MPIRSRLFAAAIVLCACSIQRRAEDPSATVSMSPPAAADRRPEIEFSTAAAAAAETLSPTPSVAPIAPKAAAAPRRSWGRIAVSTSIASPAELIGPELSPQGSYRALPVFPEKIVFDVKWGLISVGEATLGVDKIVLFNGRPAYHLISEARSNSFCDAFYPVRDLNESWLDAQTLTSLGYSKKLREGSFFRDAWVLYDRDDRRFVERQTSRDGSFRVRVGTIPAQVQDILSSVYFTRAQPLVQGGEVVIDVNTPDNWPLIVKVVKKELVKTAHAVLPAILVEPAVRREGIFIQKGKRLQLWLSDDGAHRPLQMKVEVFFGHITALMRKML